MTRRPGWAVSLWLAAAALAFLLLVGLSADLTFVSDDWRILAERTWTAGSLVEPYNEHLSIVPIVLMLVLRDVVGMASVTPYIIVVALLHLAAVAGLFVLVRPRVGDGWALVISLPMLVLGVGYENLLWAFQIGAAASVAAGVWAVVLLQRPQPRPVAASVLIAVAIASSSFALPFAITAMTLALLRRNWVACLSLAVVAIAYATWYLLTRQAAPTLCGPAGMDEVASIPVFGLASLSYAAGAPLGIGRLTQALVPIAAAVAAGWIYLIVRRVRQRDMPVLAIAALAGIVGMGVLVALSRGCLGPQAAGSSRYVYGLAFLFVIGLVDVIPAGVTGGRRAPWQLAAVLLVLVTAVGLSLRSFGIGHGYFRGDADIVRAAIAIVQSDAEGRCDTSPAVVDAFTAAVAILPDPLTLKRLIERHGDPTASSWAPWADVRPPAALETQVRDAMCDPASR